MDTLLADCAADTACRGAFPNLNAETFGAYRTLLGYEICGE
jgi:hypothetical protein